MLFHSRCALLALLAGVALVTDAGCIITDNTSACPDGLVEGEPCGMVPGEGCCDAEGNNCGDDGMGNISLVKTVCP